MAGSACSIWASRSRSRPRILLLDEPLAGLAAAERERIGALVKHLSAELPVLLVEHDIDRVFRLADHVTVMNDGKVLVDGTVEDARSARRKCRTSISAPAPRISLPSRARPRPAATCC